MLDRIEEGRERRRAGETIADGQAWRDRRLIALAAHKRRQAEEEGRALNAGWWCLSGVAARRRCG